MSVAFFYDNSGWSYNPLTETEEQGKRRGAEQLAAAETHAREMDWYYEWEIDRDGYLDAPEDLDTTIEHEVHYCQLFDANDNPLESLSGIWDATREYRRVVEAELALEAMSKGERR